MTLVIWSIIDSYSWKLFLKIFICYLICKILSGVNIYQELNVYRLSHRLSITKIIISSRFRGCLCLLQKCPWQTSCSSWNLDGSFLHEEDCPVSDLYITIRNLQVLEWYDVSRISFKREGTIPMNASFSSFDFRSRLLWLSIILFSMSSGSIVWSKLNKYSLGGFLFAL